MSHEHGSQTDNLHPEAFAYLTHQLDDEERQELFGELASIFPPDIHALIDRASAGDDEAAEKVLALGNQMSEVVRAWQVSVMLSRNADWQEQMVESAAAEPDEPTDVAELRKLLGV